MIHEQHIRALIVRFVFIFVTVATVLIGSQNVYAEPFKWIKFTGAIPANAFGAGVDDDKKTTLYICRANYNGGLHPGKMLANKCNIGWGGNEIVLDNFEVLLKLTEQKGWYWAKNPSDLNNILIGGQEPGRNLPVCVADYWSGGVLSLFRSYHGWHPGKLIANKCNIGFGGKEVEVDDFFVFKIGEQQGGDTSGGVAPLPQTCSGVESPCFCKKSSACCPTGRCKCTMDFAVCQ